jgi:carboxyl-terminal processing protease
MDNLPTILRPFTLRPLAFAVLILVTSVFSQTAFSQEVRIPSAALPAVNDVAEVLSEGQEMERSGRWGEALVHYEKAHRANPENADLKQRLDTAKLHWDVERRTVDNSYLKSVDAMQTEQALNLYSEILLKIHAHYVTPPDWHHLVLRGGDNLRIAIRTPKFLEKRVPGVDTATLKRFDEGLVSLVTRSRVENRLDARSTVEKVGELAARELRISPSVAIMEMAAGVMVSLDTYSSYLTSDQLGDVFSQIEGNFVGLGVELKTKENSLDILNVIEGSPAEQGGMKGGQTILAVDGKRVGDITSSQAADMLRGVEGSRVIVEVQEADGSRNTLHLIRRRVEVPSVVDVELMDKDFGIGYLRIDSFQKTTPADLDRALWKLYREGMKSVVVDVRGNPGGLLSASVEAADRFMTEGTIVSTRGRSTKENYDYRAHQAGTWGLPIVVLIDGDSASASEIFAGAIRDSQRGAVVGTRSYGKGSVQGIFPLAGNKSGLRLTTAKFYSPSGKAISGHGVEPTLAVVAANKPFNDGDVQEQDAALEAGLQYARTQLSQR